MILLVRAGNGVKHFSWIVMSDECWIRGMVGLGGWLCVCTYRHEQRFWDHDGCVRPAECISDYMYYVAGFFDSFKSYRLVVHRNKVQSLLHVNSIAPSTEVVSLLPDTDPTSWLPPLISIHARPLSSSLHTDIRSLIHSLSINQH